MPILPANQPLVEVQVGSTEKPASGPKRRPAWNGWKYCRATATETSPLRGNPRSVDSRPAVRARKGRRQGSVILNTKGHEGTGVANDWRPCTQLRVVSAAFSSKLY